MSGAPPPYSILPPSIAVGDKSLEHGSEVEETVVQKQRGQSKLATADSGRRIVHKLKRTIKICRVIGSEITLKVLRIRVEQLCEILRFCMAEDYLLPNSSPSTVLESWGLDSTTKLADWEDLRCGFDKKMMTATYCRYSISVQAHFRVMVPASTLGLSIEVVLLLLQIVDDAITLRKPPSPWTYIDWYIQQGCWHHVAAKLLHDKIVCQQALFTKKTFPTGFERYQRLYAAISEAIDAAETRYFTRLTVNSYTLSQYALDLCNENIRYNP
ncbi:hypothetical protein MMC17_006823 [Xylographa soralifera]|nr:hypothetical protein [Xylographa soralifera]